MNNTKLTRLLNCLLWWLVAFFGMIGLVMIAILGWYYVIIDEKSDPISWTNYGFAVAGSFSAICFSWYRTFENDAESKLLLNKIRGWAETFLRAGIFFLVAAVSKHLSMESEYFKNDIPQIYLLIVLIKISYLLFFTISLAFMLYNFRSIVCHFNDKKLVRK